MVDAIAWMPVNKEKTALIVTSYFILSDLVSKIVCLHSGNFVYIVIYFVFSLKESNNAWSGGYPWTILGLWTLGVHTRYFLAL